MSRWTKRIPAPPKEPSTATGVSASQLLVVWLVFVVLVYWLFARYMERIGMVNGGENSFLALSTPLTFILQLFNPWVLRHFTPLIVGWFLARQASTYLVATLYQLPLASAQTYFQGLVSRSPVGGIVPINADTYDEDRQRYIVLKAGGPGYVQIPVDNVIVTEINGAFFRVHGPGQRQLAAFETIYAVLDLRPQERHDEEVKLITRDGIPVHLNVRVIFRLGTGGKSPSKVEPYPYDEEAARAAAYAETVFGDGLGHWEAIPLVAVRTELTKIMSKYGLDELLSTEQSTSEVYLALREELMRRAGMVLNSSGIELLDVQLSRLELPTAVTDQYVENWQAPMQAQIDLDLGDSEAFAAEELEKARIEADLMMIRAIVEGVQRAQTDGTPATMREVVALRLIEALEKMAKESQQAYPLPAQVLPTLEMWREQMLRLPPPISKLPDKEATP